MFSGITVSLLNVFIARWKEYLMVGSGGEERAVEEPPWSPSSHLLWAPELKLQYFGHLMLELTHCKRPWCWERSKAGGEGNKRGWDGWMASLTQWTWVWASFRRWWRTGEPGTLQSMGSQRVVHDWATKQQPEHRPGQQCPGNSQDRPVSPPSLSLPVSSPRQLSAASRPAGKISTALTMSTSRGQFPSWPFQKSVPPLLTAQHTSLLINFSIRASARKHFAHHTLVQKNTVPLTVFLCFQPVCFGRPPDFSGKSQNHDKL